MPKKSAIPNNIHDQVFHELMSNRTFAIEVYKKYLPADIVTAVDFTTLDLMNLSGKVINEKNHKTSQADVVHSIKTKDGSSVWLWCHVEHQTRPEKFMPLRVTHYQCGKLLEHAKLNKSDKLPPIVTLIYHQGKAPYCYSVDLYNLFTDPILAENYFAKPILVDLPIIPDETLRANPVIGPAEMVLKYIRVRKFSQKYQEIIQEMRSLDDKTRYILIYYLLERADINEDVLAKTLCEHLPQDEDIIMTSGEQLRQEGRQQGMQQGMQQGRLEGLQEGLQQGMQKGVQQEKQLIAKNLLSMQAVSYEAIAEVTGLSIDVIKKLKTELELA